VVQGTLYFTDILEIGNFPLAAFSNARTIDSSDH